MFERVLRVAALSVVLTPAAMGLAGPAAAQTAAPPAAPAPAPAAAPAGDPAKAADPVVARVNGTEIKKSDVLRTIAALPPQVQQMPQQMIFPAVVDQIINGKLVAQAGYAAKLEDDKDVKDRVKRAEERAVQEVYLARNVESRITPEALQERYKKYLADNPPQEEVKASHILVASEADAKDIIKQLKGGADFAKLAKEKSTDKAAAAQGGDLGYFTKDQMVEPFAKAAFEAKPGTLLDQPVQTQFGWHVIKVEDRRKAPPPTFDEVQDELRTQLSESLIGKVVDDLRNKAKIEKFAADGSPLPADSGPALKPAQ